MKIQYDQSILTTEERIEAQELLFSMGFTWDKGTKVMKLYENFIVAWNSGHISGFFGPVWDAEMVTLAELRELANPWREVAKVGFPKETDYPVFVWQEGKHVGYAFRECLGIPNTFKVVGLKPYPFEEDSLITHWKRAPKIAAPEPPVVKQSKDVPPKGYRLYAPDEIIQSGEDQLAWSYLRECWDEIALERPFISSILQKNAQSIYACPEHWKPQYRTITIGGKEYLASEVNERLAQLKPIN